MDNVVQLEGLVDRTLRRHNRISLKERVAHYGRAVRLNKFSVAIGALVGLLAIGGGKSFYHDFFVANREIRETATNAKESAKSLSEAIGSTLVQMPSQSEALKVRNSYAQLLTNVRFAADKTGEQDLKRLYQELHSNAHLFSGEVLGQEGLERLNDYRRQLEQVIKRYELSGLWTLYGLGLIFMGVMGALTFLTRRTSDELFSARQREVDTLTDRIDVNLPRILNDLSEVEGRELIYRLAIIYTKETRNPEAGYNFLMVASSIPKELLSDFEKEFGRPTVEKLLVNSGNDINKNSVVKFIDARIAECEASGFDFGQVTFDSVGGYDSIKEELRLYAAIFANLKEAAREGVEGVTGIILEGPPGCGKTLLAQAFVYEALKGFNPASRRNHHKVLTAADLKSVWYSYNAKNVQSLYRNARRNTPYIVFIDEGESLFAERGSGHSADTETTNQFLTEIGGVSRTDGVITVITTNRMEAVDIAAKRYGRLGVHYEVDIPDQSGRKEIAKKHLTRLGRTHLIAEFDNDKFAAETDGLTGADIAGVINNTFLDRYKAIKLGTREPYQLTTEDFLRTAATYHKTVKPPGQ